MKRLIFACLLFLTTRFAAAAAPAPIDLEWKDDTRNRPVPVKIYLPAGDGPAPIVIFSHGLGGSRDGYAYLGKYWSEHGYVAVHVQHVGSDTSVWKDALPAERMTKLKAAANPKELVARVADVKFTIDQLTFANTDPGSPLHGRLDLANIAIAGHSFGGHTSQAVAGEHFAFKLGGGDTMGDPRIKCAIVMSPSPPEMRSATAAAFGKIAMPILFMTGTEDDSPIGDIKAKDRRLPFDGSSSGDKYLITFAGCDHMVFAGAPRLLGKPREIDKTDQPLILKSTTAFLDAYLKKDGAAKKYLQNQFKTDAGATATFEMK